MSETYAMIGLGLMGGTLASHLLSDGHKVVGYDPVPNRRIEHGDKGGKTAISISEAVDSTDIAILSLPNSTIMLDVCQELIDTKAKGLLVIDTTTGAPEDSIIAADRLAKGGISYVDATVSGNASQAATRDIIFMVGGADEQVKLARKVLDPLSRHVYAVGAIGSGARAKLVVNHVLSINRAAIAEGLAVAEKAGLDLAPTLTILRDSAAYSIAMDIWGDRMVEANHYPASSRVRQSLKDSRLINTHAESVGASTELVKVVKAALEEAEETGLSDADNSSVMEIMRRRAGIGRI